MIREYDYPTDPLLIWWKSDDDELTEGLHPPPFVHGPDGRAYTVREWHPHVVGKQIVTATVVLEIHERVAKGVAPITRPAQAES